MTKQLSAETLVIGSGPGGSVMADELQRGGQQVLMVEEGHLAPQGSFSPYSLQEMIHQYRNGGITTTFGKTTINYVEGSCVGGGSEVNSGLYFRTPADVIDQWCSNYQVDHFSADTMAPHFAACEQQVNVCHLPGKAPANSLKLLQGAQQLGWDCPEIPRIYRYQSTPDASPIEGTRQSMSETYIPSFRAAGGQLETGVRITRVSRRGNLWTATGISPADGENIEIKADRIVVAAGAIHSPFLLRHSGFQKNIGNNLKLHSTAKVIAHFEQEINNPLAGVGVHQIREFAPQQAFGCAVSAPCYLKLSLLDNPDFQQDMDAVWRNMASYYVMISGGVGSIRGLPLVKDPIVRYRLDKPHLINLALGLKRLCRVMFAAGATKVYPSIQGQAHLSSESDLHKLPNVLDPRRTSLMTIHLMGSCPMGEDLNQCAVDSFGQVHDAAGLYVSDASLIGNELGVNPQGTIMALARRNAHHMLGKL